MNIAKMMRQVQEMQGKMNDMQGRLGDIEVDGQSGAGMVAVTMNGKGEVKKIKIAPGLLVPDEVEILEDLLIAALNDAKTKVDEKVSGETEKLMGGINLPPNFKLPF